MATQASKWEEDQQQAGILTVPKLAAHHHQILYYGTCKQQWSTIETPATHSYLSL
jgi:hypothetical protein